MTEAAKHTPTPWRVGDRAPYVEVWGRMQMNGYPIIASLEHEPREANAHFIVKAVNAFEAQARLVETLTHALDALVAAASDGAFESEWLERALSSARTALAQARKE